jgi:hypothetical protein
MKTPESLKLFDQKQERQKSYRLNTASSGRTARVQGDLRRYAELRYAIDTYGETVNGDGGRADEGDATEQMKTLSARRMKQMRSGGELAMGTTDGGYNLPLSHR